MIVIPSLDILDGKVVRLTRGDFNNATVYGDAGEVLDSLEVPDGSRLHVVDLAGSRDGKPVAVEVVRALAARRLRVQVGGGVRTVEDARQWIDAGAEKVVIGTVAADDPRLLIQIVEAVGPERVIASIDVLDGAVRVAGWQRDARRDLPAVLQSVEAAEIEEILVTDISRDGVLGGPSFDLYRQLAGLTSVRVVASGGVATLGDIRGLSRLRNVSACVVGKALLERRFSLAEATARESMPHRIIPCLDIRDGRVVKGVNFTGIRDAGDPVECARRYEAEGADEIVVLDISATDRATETALDTIRRIADSLFIPLTVGGGVRSVDDFRAFLQAGADRVAINTAAVRRPQLIREVATEFGVQAVVLSCDAASNGNVAVRAGKEVTDIDAVDWCKQAEELGAGEILLTAIERDGTTSGFDLDLLRSVTGAVRISVIASGGAGNVIHFRDAIERGGARAVLAASLFHDSILSVRDVKSYLAAEGIPVR
jgi:cyclase